MSTEKSLRASLSSIKGKFTTIENGLTAQGSTKLTTERFEKILSLLDGYWAQTETCHEQLFAHLADQAAQDAQNAEHSSFFTRYQDLVDKAVLLKPDSVPLITKAKVKLPDLKPPTFDGDICNWTSFYDLFKAAVHNNDSIEPAQKLQYLMDSMKGDAGNVIKHLSISDNHYAEAWKILEETYNRKCEIVDAHLLRFLNQASMKEESGKALRKLIDTTRECLKALEVLGLEVDKWDAIIVLIIREKLDAETKRQWFLQTSPTVLPTVKDLLQFLDKRSRSIQDAPTKSKPTTSLPSSQQKSSSNPPKKETKSLHATSDNKCRICNDSVHFVYTCPVFRNLTPPERMEQLKTNRLCFNCMFPGHTVQSCPSKTNCKKCNRRHHTMIHLESNQSSHPKQTSSAQCSSEPVDTHCAHVSHGPTRPSFSHVLLPTAVVNLRDSKGMPQPVRALLDSASESSFISEQCVKKLGLRAESTNVTVSGLAAAAVATARGKVQLSLSSRVYEFKTSFEALVVPRVTGKLPTQSCKEKDFSYLSDLPLADPFFYDSASIDLLLGADIFYQLNRPTKSVQGPPGLPTATDTMLGWVIAGKYHSNKVSTLSAFHVTCELDTLVQRFWELEKVPGEKIFPPEDAAAEEHYVSTFQRLADGRYMVRLPMKKGYPNLGNSRDNAVRRWLQMEKRMARDETLRTMYVEFMREYAKLDHMKKVPSHYVPKGSIYYIPHHAVLKDSSSTTKLRVVFDASAKSTTGTSLNENMMNGPKTQDDLIGHLIRFFLWLIVSKADARQMYRQFKVHPDDWDLQRIIWREQPNLMLEDWWLTTVTQGESASAFLATRSLNQLAKDNELELPAAALAIRSNVYMDDLVTGAFSVEKALQLQVEILDLFKRGQIELRKWNSNHHMLLDNIPTECREFKCSNSDQTCMTLGIIWNPSKDEVSCPKVLLGFKSKLTKRVILAEVAKIFDPMGWLAPVVIKLKILLQSLWQEKLEWDDEVPKYVEEEWLLLHQQFLEFETVHFPRLATLPNPDAIEIFGFSDASEKAYAACVYLRSKKGDDIKVQLFMSKTRVAPLRQETLPRLELCGAVLLVELVNTVRKYVQLPINEVHLFTDSTIVLAWIDSPPAALKTFVANRVSQIQQSYDRSYWHHVKGSENPADCVSRGIYPNEFGNHPLWWTGPAWLAKEPLPFTSGEDVAAIDSLPEVKKLKTKAHLHQVFEGSILERYSSLLKVQRVVALCFRFYYRMIDKKIRPRRPPSSELITISELDFALTRCLSLCQRIDFCKELYAMENNMSLSKKSKLLSLNPFLDSNGLIRVGGRLRNSGLPMDQKHPILLPRHGQLTRNVLHDEHLRGLHAGPQLLLSMVRERYWIIRGRDAIRHFVANCVVCFRARATGLTQIMADLPKVRVNSAKAFMKVGIDFAGPIMCKSSFTPRSPQKFKAYVSVFVCMVTHAIHLELVSDLSSRAFIAALKRFVSRRGLCTDMFSDNGTNFIGAEKEICGLVKGIESSVSSGDLSKDIQLRTIRWHFNPPSGPHFGGMWEAAVKSMKTHLKKTVGEALLNYEEFLTVLNQIEACVNSRPLTPMSSDPSDLQALTPGHFLVYSPLNAIPEEDLTGVKLLPRDRWLLCQKIMQHFWVRWQQEYLTSLQQRHKWKSEQSDIEINELVLLKDERFPPLQWKLARVISLHPGDDGHIRVVTVKTCDGEYKRPIAKICPLPKGLSAEAKECKSE